MNEARLPKLSTEAHEAIATLLMLGWTPDRHRRSHDNTIRYIDPPVEVMDRLRTLGDFGKYIDISMNEWAFLRVRKLKPSYVVNIITTCPIEEWRRELRKMGVWG